MTPSMTSRERMLAALECGQPDHVPACFMIFAALHKEYRTPAGTLTTVVNETEDWPYPGYIPLFDDYICPRAHQGWLHRGKKFSLSNGRKKEYWRPMAKLYKMP